jgi:dTDP-4-dehydrorhamnose reductase
MLGGQLKKVFPEAIAWDKQDCDITNFEDLKSKILSLQPTVIINSVAYNDVDGAEKKSEQAFLLNSEVPKVLSQVCKEQGITLVHFSTNYVFDGQKGEYAETDSPKPLSIYSESKYKGEQEIINSGCKYFLVRTSVIFGPKGESEFSKKSFVEIMLDLSSKQDTIKVVSDEVNSLTYAKDLAENLKKLTESNKPSGIYHITNSGQASWYEYAKEIFKIKNASVNLIPISSSELPRVAKRPPKAVLMNTKLPLIRPWQEALKEFLIS